MTFIPDPKRLPGGFTPDCQHPSHYPPNMMVFPSPGVWRCPACGFESRVGGFRITYATDTNPTVHGGFPDADPEPFGPWGVGKTTCAA